MAKLRELFNVEYGSNFDLARVEEIDIKNGVPYVSRTEKNNGVATYLKELDESVKLNKPHTLSVALGGSVLETFYQGEPYYTGYHIAVLTPINEMTKEQMLYYAMCIKENKIKYSYGRQANRTLRDIELPDFEKIPTWVDNHVIGNVELVDNNTQLKINTEQCEDIHLFKLFNIERGESPSIQDMLMKPGQTPIVSSSGQNNGVAGYTSYPPNFNIENGSTCLTLATNGTIGSCFFQDQPFVGTGNVSILVPKKGVTINRYNAIYIATLLKREGNLKYSYGRIWDDDLVKNTQIKFPMKDGEIDWPFIEKYIKNIEEQYKINRNSKSHSVV